MLLSKSMFCKVCQVLITTRRPYRTKTCEACQKFFRRNCSDPPASCVRGGQRCGITFNDRKICTFCRFKKCIHVGLRSKFLTPDTVSKFETGNAEEDKGKIGSDADDDLVYNVEAEKPPNPKSKEQKTLSLLKGPQLYEETLIENILNSSVQAYPELHYLEFLGFKGPITSIEHEAPILFQKCTEQAFTSLGISVSFGKKFLERIIPLSNDEMTILGNAGVFAIMAVYNNLLGNKGASFFGLDNALVPLFLDWYPGFKRCKALCDSLSTALEKWNPTLAQASLLLVFLFLNGPLSQHKKVQAMQHFVFMAFNQHIASTFRDRPDIFAINRHYFKKCVRLSKSAIAENHRAISSLDQADPIAQLAKKVAETSLNKTAKSAEKQAD